MDFLLITDLDNTLVGDDDGTIAFNQALAPLRSQLCLVYSTGRSLTSTAQLFKERPLLIPDMLITGVGTGVYRLNAANSDSLEDWADPDPGWSNALSAQWDRAAIAALTQRYPALIPQPETEQNPWKLSFWLTDPAAEVILATLAMELQELGIAAQLIYSSRKDVDILPQRANKGNAALYLQTQTKAGTTLVCGDSGNDISLFEQVNLGIIVQNSQSELLDWHRQNGESGHYLARSPYAWGMLEGLQHFNWIP